MEQIFDVVWSEVFNENLLIALGFSVILFVSMQKIKELPFIKNNVAIWITNFILAMALGIPYSLYYFKLPLFEACVVGFISFVGAPVIYEMLKKQNVINYTPKPKQDVISIKKENELSFKDGDE